MVRIGNKIEGEKYTKRPGAYAIIERKEDNKIAIATVPEGDWFLLGGGIENKETEIEALKRELIEESGYSIKNIKYFDKVTSWADGKEKGHALVSADLLKEEMIKLDYNEEIIEKCYKAIYKHSWKAEPETIEGIIIRDADKIDFVGINRWKQAIDSNCKFGKVLQLLPTLRGDLLKLDISKKIFDREIANLVVFMHNKIFNN